jgi:hypothetical protein
MADRTADIAADSAWRSYLLLHSEVDEIGDRCDALRHYIADLCEAGERNPDTLQKAGLVYLRELDQERMKSR